MKLLLIPAMVLGLAAVPAAAWAQGDQHQQGGTPHATPPTGHMAAPSHPSSPPRTAPSVHRSAPAHTTPVHHVTHHVTHHVVHHVTHRTIVHHRVVTTVHRRVVTTTHRTPVDIAKYRRTIVATRHFHIGVYRAPPGYVYRRWGIGERLPGPFFARDFWIGDFGLYGLIAPPFGYVWVRYGPDAVLIDEYTGEVIQVEYGLFL